MFCMDAAYIKSAVCWMPRGIYTVWYVCCSASWRYYVVCMYGWHGSMCSLYIILWNLCVSCTFLQHGFLMWTSGVHAPHLYILPVFSVPADDVIKKRSHTRHIHWAMTGAALCWGKQVGCRGPIEREVRRRRAAQENEAQERRGSRILN